MTAPLEVALDEGGLHVRWTTSEVLFTARRLREACRCAECTARSRRGEAVQADDALQVVDVAPIGAYAAQLTFSDGHQRGVYPWSMLHDLAAGVSG